MTQCKATKSDGTPCQSPFVDPETGYCASHGPGSAGRMSARGRRGAEALAVKNRGRGTVDSEKAPAPPETMEDAARIASWACHGVYTGLLDPRVGQQTAALLREFRTATKESDLAARMQKMEARLAELDK